MKKETMIELIKYIIIILVVVLIRTFIITPVKVNGSSMYNTLENNEIMILNKLKYRVSSIKRFDIVVVNADNDKLIKRVIGLPGETIEYKDEKLYINGKYIKDKYAYSKTNDFSLEDIGLKKLPKNCYFVMGDNRSNSKDSRYFGCVDRKDILGSANLVLFPFSKIGYKK